MTVSIPLDELELANQSRLDALRRRAARLCGWTRPFGHVEAPSSNGCVICGHDPAKTDGMDATTLRFTLWGPTAIQNRARAALATKRNKLATKAQRKRNEDLLEVLILA